MVGPRAHRLFRILVLTVLAAPFLHGTALAGVSGSPHDFSSIGAIVVRSACSGCHRVHTGGATLLWSRDLSEETTYFDQTANPNYVPDATLLCYDCHDPQLANIADQDPDPNGWGLTSHGTGEPGTPQDIALSDGPPPGPIVGYYERIDATLPTGASGGGPQDGSPTGGHYWQSLPDTTGRPYYEQGDKLACSICHDPHNSRTGTNEAMFLTETSDGTGGMITLGDGRTASYNTRVNSDKTSAAQRQIYNGRTMCASCHRYSDEPNAAGATAEGIPTSTVVMWGVNLPQPPNTLPDHAYDGNSTVACTDCHKHNKIYSSCSDCHDYPPLTGAHLAHIKGIGGLETDPDKYDFGCLNGTCHPGNSHGVIVATGVPTNVVDPVNVQVSFNSNAVPRLDNPAGDAWNPNGVFNQGVVADPLDDTCTELYCHSNGLVENGVNIGDEGSGENGASGLGEYAETGRTGTGTPQATFYGTTLAKPAVWGGSLDCKGCHGKDAPDYQRQVGITAPTVTSATVYAPDYYNFDGVAVPTPQHVVDGATIYNTTGANTHFIHVYKIDNQDATAGLWAGSGCGCHPTRDQYPPPNSPAIYHLNRQVDIGDQGAVNDLGVGNSEGRGCANLCHNGPDPADWGASLDDGTANNDSCAFVCHGKSDPLGANYYGASPGGRITKAAASADPENRYMQSGHGATAAYPSGNGGANLPCSSCHLADDRSPNFGPYHYERVATATGNANAPLASGQPGANPYWLLTAPTDYSSDPDGLCRSCHDGAPATEFDAGNHTAQVMIDVASFNPKYDTGAIGTWDTFTPNCISCHDPHGEANWSMLYDADAEKTAVYGGLIFTGPVAYTGSRFGATRAQTDTHGVPPPPYATTQKAVTMTGNTTGGDFVDLTYTANDGICQVCHTLTKFYRADGTNPGGGHPTSLCTDCHEHTPGFAPSACEGCHNAIVCYDPDGAGPQRPAPNVMGDGVDAVGTDPDAAGPLGVLPYNDGTWGYNVNGHGTRTWTPPSAAERGVFCTDCHLTESHHADGTLNTLDWPGAAGNNVQTTNTSHLVTGYFTAGSAQAQQKAFDDYCTDTCHPGAIEMRHSTKIAGVPDGFMQFGEHTTNTDPKKVRAGETIWGDASYDSCTPADEDERYTPGVDPTPPPGDPATSYWFPWTISDHTSNAAAPPYFGTCASCHDPHGIPTGDVSRSSNHMVRFNWKRPPSTDPPFFCNSQCHRP